jgi:hypothetical protein
MTSRDLFTTAIRAFGVWQLLRGFDFALQAFDTYAGYFKPMSTSIGSCCTHVVFYTLTGIYLLYGAPHVVAAIYSKSHGDK